MTKKRKLLVTNERAPLAPCHFIQVMIIKRRLREKVPVDDHVALSPSEMAERWRQLYRKPQG